ncbi:MAG: LCP family protein, partial [Armatimonadetes bacterium]|nr:LCP family protein [Anaerolineae bacterium]
MKALRRVFGLIAFRLLPLMLLLAAGWFGWQTVQSISRVWGEQSVYAARAEGYPATATALAAPQSAALLVDYRIGQKFITNTPRPENPQAPSATPMPPSAAGATATIPALGNLDATPTIIFADDAVAGAVFNGTAVPTAVTPVERQYDLLNILLLGQDNEITGDALARTDTMIIVSINRETNTVNMINLPRDLYVYMPNGIMGRLNTVYEVGENIGWTGGGVFFMRQTLLYNLGINIHYYALVNISGFAEVIDLLGGVDVAVDCALEDLPLIGAELPKGVIASDEEDYYILPVGYYFMSGKEALWYARSRHNSDDFDRGRRQQQLLRAGWRRAREIGLLTQLPGLWGQATEIVETDLPFSQMVSLLPASVNLNTSALQNFRWSRIYHTTPWQTSDGDYVQIPNPDPVRELMTAFYAPPTQNQVAVDVAQVRVFNGTVNADWDQVAVERLGWSGISAAAAGVAA